MSTYQIKWQVSHKQHVREHDVHSTFQQCSWPFISFSTLHLQRTCLERRVPHVYQGPKFCTVPTTSHRVLWSTSCVKVKFLTHTTWQILQLQQHVYQTIGQIQYHCNHNLWSHFAGSQLTSSNGLTRSSDLLHHVSMEAILLSCFKSPKKEIRDCPTITQQQTNFWFTKHLPIIRPSELKVWSSLRLMLWHIFAF